MTHEWCCGGLAGMMAFGVFTWYVFVYKKPRRTP